MFTGIVQALGRVRSFEQGRLVVERGEFVSVSLLGHLAYGTTLGLVTVRSAAARNHAHTVAGAGQ